MLSPHFKASLRLVHPSMPSPEISQGLEADSKWGWIVGEERRSPAGDPLAGRYRTSYWVADLSSGGDDSLVDLLAVCLDRLEERRNFLSAFHRSGGRTEFFVGWFRSPGETLPCPLLGRLASLGIGLAFDVCPDSLRSRPHVFTG